MDTTKVKEELDKVLENLAVKLCEYVDRGHENGRPVHFTHEYTSKANKAILTLIDKYTRESLINTLEDLKRTDWVDRDTTEPTNSNNKEK